MNIIDFLFVFKWWAVFFMLGTIFLPLAFKLFSSFLDKGYIFSKVLGISILSYLIFVFGIAHVLPFTRILSGAILIVLAVFFWIKISFKKKILSVGTRKDVLQFLRKHYSSWGFCFGLLLEPTIRISMISKSIWISVLLIRSFGPTIFLPKTC